MFFSSFFVKEISSKGAFLSYLVACVCVGRGGAGKGR